MNFMRRYFGQLLVVTFFLAGLHTASAEVKVWEGTLKLPVYEEGTPNPNPPFDQYNRNTNYPYTLRDQLTNKRVDHDWRAVYLENEYLKCTILPDLGGHLYTCIDKLSNQPMFYANPSIKKAEIGYRGGLGRGWNRIQFPRIAQLDYPFAYRLFLRQKRGRQRFSFYRKHRPRVRNAVYRRDGASSRVNGSGIEGDAE